MSAVRLLGDLVPAASTAGKYMRIARGERDFLAYWTFTPWDHAPGGLILAESGGALRELATGSAYNACTRPLLHLAAAALWSTMSEAFLSGLTPEQIRELLSL